MKAFDDLVEGFTPVVYRFLRSLCRSEKRLNALQKGKIEKIG